VSGGFDVSHCERHYLDRVASDDHKAGCPFRVIFRPRTASELGLFIPQQQTSGDRNSMSVSCQHATWTTCTSKRKRPPTKAGLFSALSLFSRDVLQQAG
jgi:hypothetical protein